MKDFSRFKKRIILGLLIDIEIVIEIGIEFRVPTYACRAFQMPSTTYLIQWLKTFRFLCLKAILIRFR
ncbi:MAG: hypothetical protein DRH90_21825 [Deltaproteobacteria bacterium]|nr:MAG: hypothetical protein DRH90_21825 [Deltaproteobacteria bacterium]